MPKRLDSTILDLIESAQRNVKALPLNLGGLPGAGGGIGTPPGGFIGQLIQTRVAYDLDEAATLATVGSGSLLDNLNHIRYRINILESGASITIVDENTINTYLDVDTIHFSGAGVTVVDLGGGDVNVVINATGSGGGAALTVEEYDDLPSVTNVDKVIFSGMKVEDGGSGDAIVTAAGHPNLVLYFSGTDSDIGGYDTLARGSQTDSSGTNSASLTADDTLIKAYALTAKNFYSIVDQEAVADLWLGKSGGTKQAQFYIKVFHRTSGGTETLIGTSGLTPATTDFSTIRYRLYFPVASRTFEPTDRLVIKVYGNPVGAGTDPTGFFSSNSTLPSRISFGVDTLNGQVAPETNSNDIFSVSSAGDSDFVGTIATLPGGATLTYNVGSGNENVMVPTATTQLGKMRLYNTTRGTNALISNTVIGTNTITLTANVPAGWQVGDAITTYSQTVTGTPFGVHFTDIELTAGPMGRNALFIGVIVNDTGGAGGKCIIHPFETFSASKNQQTITQTTQNQTNMAFVALNSNVISVAWDATGAATTTVTLRELGYML